jgi:UDP-N-acetylmuramate--alanine ligase
MNLAQSKFHFVGVGGIGMCGLAELLHNMGAQVSGSDLAENANTERLRNLGVKVFRGHRAEHVGDVDVVVFSSAVKDSNPEIQVARGRKIPLIPRAEALAEIMHLKRGVAVAGTHGKTTTTSMTAAIFLEAQTDPTIVVGGRFDKIKSTALLGKGEWLIAEADESDGSFHKLSPEISIITNIDSDHLDHFKTFENLQSSFVAFALKIPFYGVNVVWGDDPQVRILFKDFPKKVLFYGFNEDNDYVLKGEKGKYQLSHNTLTSRQILGDFELRLPGRHNALNATAAVIVGLHCGFSFNTCREALANFEGVDRRFQFKGEKKNIRVYDDYGHHPTEVRATLQAFREKFPDKKIVILFQPHRYSRTESCWYDFTQCFTVCDEILLTDIYPAGEAPIEGINSQRLQKEVKHSHCFYYSKDAQLAEHVMKHLQPGNVFVTLGAGDGWKVGMQVLEKLSQ